MVPPLAPHVILTVATLVITIMKTVLFPNDMTPTFLIHFLPQATCSLRVDVLSMPNGTRIKVVVYARKIFSLKYSMKAHQRKLGSVLIAGIIVRSMTELLKSLTARVIIVMITKTTSWISFVNAWTVLCGTLSTYSAHVLIIDIGIKTATMMKKLGIIIAGPVTLTKLLMA